jgi:hypothetical protein
LGLALSTIYIVYGLLYATSGLGVRHTGQADQPRDSAGLLGALVRDEPHEPTGSRLTVRRSLIRAWSSPQQSHLRSRPLEPLQKLTGKLSQLLRRLPTAHNYHHKLFSELSNTLGTQLGNSIAGGHSIREDGRTVYSVLRIYLWPTVVSSNTMIRLSWTVW